ncbi:MAG: hypothetical protein M1833_000761 [Piccolia ochrophora]|nr:MAG: hypothetical protein M1833_000761 [Piccolia ochrophora]
MSWKGFTKGVTRAPQTVKQRFNVGETTKDAVYIDAERRFQELEQETKKLHDESKKYFDAINGMLNHQIEFSKAVAEIYRPISGRVSDPDSFVQEGNPEGIRACEEYENIVRDLLATLQPELEMIETRVIRPADELLEIIKVIRKTATKRQHKQIDFDRHNATLQKLKDKKEKTLKDEKAMYKAENDAEQATQEFNYFNDLLKEELPQLFRLEREFIRPLFQSFYYMQLNVFYTLHERMQAIHIGYFDLTLDIEESFEAKRGDIKDKVEALSIVHFKTTGGKKPGQRPGAGRLAIEGKTSRPLAIEAKPTSPSLSPAVSSAHKPGQDSLSSPPPPYSPASPDVSGVNRANSTGSAWGAAAKAKGAAPPPPKPKPARLSGAPTAETATALYDYEAQAEGDLSFSTGDVIELVHRGATENEWWTGKINGKQGQFPGAPPSRSSRIVDGAIRHDLQRANSTLLGNYVRLN